MTFEEWHLKLSSGFFMYNTYVHAHVCILLHRSVHIHTRKGDKRLTGGRTFLWYTCL